MKAPVAPVEQAPRHIASSGRRPRVPSTVARDVAPSDVGTSRAAWSTSGIRAGDPEARRGHELPRVMSACSARSAGIPSITSAIAEQIGTSKRSRAA